MSLTATPFPYTPLFRSRGGPRPGSAPQRREDRAGQPPGGLDGPVITEVEREHRYRREDQEREGETGAACTARESHVWGLGQWLVEEKSTPLSASNSSSDWPEPMATACSGSGAMTMGMPVSWGRRAWRPCRSEEHTSELQ